MEFKIISRGKKNDGSYWNTIEKIVDKETYTSQITTEKEHNSTYLEIPDYLAKTIRWKIKPKKPETISEVFVFINERFIENAGIRTFSGNVYFMPIKRLSAITGLEKSKFHFLQKSTIAPEFYKQGEIMAGGNVCTQEKKIIKNLNFEFQQNVDVSENDVSDNYQENSNWEADFTRDALDGFEDAYWNID